MSDRFRLKLGGGTKWRILIDPSIDECEIPGIINPFAWFRGLKNINVTTWAKVYLFIMGVVASVMSTFYLVFYFF